MESEVAPYVPRVPVLPENHGLRSTVRVNARRAPKTGPKPRTLLDPTLYPGCNWHQDTFARVLAQTSDGEQAFTAAGYGCPPFKPVRSQADRGHRIARLSKARGIMAATEHYSALALQKYDASRNSIIAQLVRFGWVDPADYVDADGKPLPLHQLPRDVRMAIQDFDIVYTDNGPVHRYRFVPKLKSMELLAKVASLLDPKAAEFRKQSKTRVRLRFEAGGEAIVESIEG